MSDGFTPEDGPHVFDDACCIPCFKQSIQVVIEQLMFLKRLFVGMANGLAAQESCSGLFIAGIGCCGIVRWRFWRTHWEEVETGGEIVCDIAAE